MMTLTDRPQAVHAEIRPEFSTAEIRSKASLCIALGFIPDRVRATGYPAVAAEMQRLAARGLTAGNVLDDPDVLAAQAVLDARNGIRWTPGARVVRKAARIFRFRRVHSR